MMRCDQSRRLVAAAALLWLVVRLEPRGVKASLNRPRSTQRIGSARSTRARRHAVRAVRDASAELGQDQGRDPSHRSPCAATCARCGRAGWSTCAIHTIEATGTWKMSAGDALHKEEVREGGRIMTRDRATRGSPSRVVRGDVPMPAVAAPRVAIHTLARQRRRMMEVRAGAEKRHGTQSSEC